MKVSFERANTSISCSSRNVFFPSGSFQEDILEGREEDKEMVG
jgi:hypothetical protein